MHLLPTIIAAALLIFFVTPTWAIEQAAYTTVKADGPYEIRDYEPCIVAEVVVPGTLEEAGNTAFRMLFRYISGGNRGREKIEMTTPVSQQPRPEKIAMTAPVGQQQTEEGWAVSFLMPAAYTMQSLPVPEDSAVQLREIPARRMAAVRYSGRWTEARYQRHKDALLAWMDKHKLPPIGEPVWARYNPPFTPWFMRRNEILIPIEAPRPEVNE